MRKQLRLYEELEWEKEYPLDVQLFENARSSKAEEVRELVESLGGRVSDVYERDHLRLMRVHIRGEWVKMLLDFPGVMVVASPPQPYLS